MFKTITIHKFIKKKKRLLIRDLCKTYFSRFNHIHTINKFKEFLLFYQISQVIYLELEQREKQKEKDERAFVEEYGDKAFKEIEKLK